MPAPPRFTHVVLKVADLDRSIAFYRSFCGLEVVRDGRPSGHTVWMAPAARPPGDPPWVLVLYLTRIDFHLDHLGFQVASRADVDRIAAEAAPRGWLVQGPVDGGGDIGYLVMLQDPDGHRVEFTYGQPIAGVGG
jgi:catechol 2,3-dioxygenase-like lactoylglutathione lyase family enzyme